jgi:hypothetical protein
VDQREWDYGARLPRDRRASEAYSTQDGPESTETPQWGSVADTGSLEPSPEAIAWARRADAWAQQPAADEGGQWEQPASRWSEIVPTGRQMSYTADGVGWRTETAEWLAAEQTARWRQTTEWRSADGDHGWRSTTEAWQTGGNAEGLQPPVDPSTRQQLAISSTAWPTPSDDPQAANPEAAPQSGPWQQFTETTPPWQQPVAEARPAWQQFAAPAAPWEQGTASAQPWQQGAAPPSGPPAQRMPESQPSWQQLVEPTSGRPQTPPPPRPPTWQNPISAAPSWQNPVSAAPGWQTPAAEPPAWQSPAADVRPYTGSWSGGLDDGSHLVREDDRDRWRREAASGMPGVGERTVGRRRAADQGIAGPGDGTGWSGFTPSGSMAAPETPAIADRPNWRDEMDVPARRQITSRPEAVGRAEAPDWRDRMGTAGRQNGSAEPDWRDRTDVSGRPDRAGAPDWRDRGEDPGRRDRTDPLPWQGRTDTTDRRNGSVAPDWRDGTGGPSGRRDDDRWNEPPADWRARAEAPDWRDGTDAGGRNGRRGATDWRDRTDAPGRPDRTDAPIRRDRAEAPGWRDRTEISDWQENTDGPTWRRDDGRRDEPSGDWRDRSDNWRSEPDSGSWSRGDERREDWRRRDDTDDDTGDPGWRDAGTRTGNWRRDARPATDPWAPNVADTGVIPMSWEQPASDTGSWRAPDGGIPRRRMADDAPLPADVWRPEGAPRREGTNWPADEPQADWREQIRQEDGLAPPIEAVTEIRQRIDPETWRRVGQEPPDWQREEREQAARGSAPYRAGDTGDWRRGLALESELTDGEPRRFGTQEFVPFRPSGSAAVPTSAPVDPRSAPPAPVQGSPAQGPQEYAPQGRPAQNGRENLLVPSNDTNGARWQDPPDTQWPPRGAVTGSYERRAVSSMPGPSGRANLLEPEDDEVEKNNGGPLAAVGYTVIWYGVPVVLFVLYMLVLNGSQQSHALSTLAGAAPQFGLSLVLSMVVAVGLRWASGSWKAASVGLAAAVMGGGLATVLTSAITGNSLS